MHIIEKETIQNILRGLDLDSIIEDVMSKGAYGAKLLGSGGCGFVLAVCDSKSKKNFMYFLYHFLSYYLFLLYFVPA